MDTTTIIATLTPTYCWSSSNICLVKQYSIVLAGTTLHPITPILLPHPPPQIFSAFVGRIPPRGIGSTSAELSNPSHESNFVERYFGHPRCGAATPLDAGDQPRTADLSVQTPLAIIWTPILSPETHSLSLSLLHILCIVHSFILKYESKENKFIFTTFFDLNFFSSRYMHGYRLFIKIFMNYLSLLRDMCTKL